MAVELPLLTSLLESGIDGHCFDFYVVSAAPEDVVHSALAGIVPPERIIATRFVQTHPGRATALEAAGILSAIVYSNRAR